MFRQTVLSRAVPVFSLFIRRNSSDARLKGLTIAERGRTLGKWYRALSKTEKATLIADAKNAPAAPRGRKAPSKYHQFLKTELAGKTNGSAPERLKAAVAKWHRQTKS